MLIPIIHNEDELNFSLTFMPWVVSVYRIALDSQKPFCV